MLPLTMQVRGLSGATLSRLAPDLLEDAADYFERAVKQAVLDYRRYKNDLYMNNNNAHHSYAGHAGCFTENMYGNAHCNLLYG